ncbi:hypothetical protein GCM10025859_41900 [Alicyclobacillus fastidiosus]|nr:hypothetical protein GCM10025859_41900 [Alicyclobacillus fastidiosus]
MVLTGTSTVPFDDDTAPVADRDPVNQLVGLIEVLRCQQHGGPRPHQPVGFLPILLHTESPKTQQPVRKYSGKVRAAGIIQIVTSCMWGVITLVQIVYVLQNGIGTTNLFVAAWNTIMTVYGIIEGVKLLNGRKTEARAGFRSAVAGIVWYLIQPIGPQSCL